MKLLKVAGATSETWQIFIRDSSSTTGAGKTGLVFNTASLTAYYHRDTDTTATAISLVTMTAGTFTSGGFVEIDATNMPGWYQFCPPNAAIAAGAKSCAFLLKGATNMAPVPIEVQLSAVNPDSATAFISSVATVTTVTDLTTTTYGEPGQGAPGVSVSLKDKIGYIYKSWRNHKTTTSSQFTLYADDTTTVDQKAAISDNGTTFDAGEIASGP